MFLKSIHDVKPKISVTNSAQYTKDESDHRFKHDSRRLRQLIELEYKQTVTRTLDDDELSKHVPENLVDKILASYHKKIQNSEHTRRPITCRTTQFDTASLLSDNKILTRRHKMVHSAPAPRSQIQFQTKTLSDRAEISHYTFRSALSSSTYVKNSKTGKKREAEKKISWNFKHHQKELKSQCKSIMRDQKPIVSKSMSVEKWIEIHRRRSGIAAPNLTSQTESVSQDEDFYAKYEFFSVPNQKKSRSIREISELTMLDKVQERIRKEINEKIKNLRKIESKNEFNAIVNRIKAFLDELENPLMESSFVSSMSTMRNEKITLYELALA